MRLLVSDDFVLFPVGLNESSLSCFWLLMRVPSGLLRVSWPSPRKEMMQLWLLVSQADPSLRTPERMDIQTETPCRVEEFWLYKPASGFFWMKTHISVPMWYMSEPECSRFRIKLWCQSFRRDFTLLFLLPSLNSAPFTPISQYFSNLASAL